MQIVITKWCMYAVYFVVGLFLTGVFSLMVMTVIDIFSRSRWFCDKMGWRKAPKSQGFDGCSFNGVCPRCGAQVKQDKATGFDMELPLLASSLYKITYANGFVQKKFMVSQAEYDIEYPAGMKEAYELELKGKKSEANFIKSSLIKKFGSYGEFFTERSPLALAINNGMLKLPDSQGGVQPCNVELIKYYV